MNEMMCWCLLNWGWGSSPAGSWIDGDWEFINLCEWMNNINNNIVEYMLRWLFDGGLSQVQHQIQSKGP